MLSHQPVEPDIKLSGTLPSLARFARTPDANINDFDLEVWGDLELLTALKGIATGLELDWEQALADRLGDIAGHQLANALRSHFNWLEDRRNTLERLLSEFLTEELGASPTTTELNTLHQGIDRLRTDTDRISARVELLRQRLSKQAEAQQ